MQVLKKIKSIKSLVILSSTNLMRLNDSIMKGTVIFLRKTCFIRLETVVRKGFVCLSHAVYVFTFFHRSAFTFRCIKQLTSKT